MTSLTLTVPALTRRDSSVDQVTPLVGVAEPVYPSRTAALVAKVTRGLQRCQSLMKDSPLTVLGLSAKQNPKISEIIDQSKILCEDYIFGRMLRTGELSGSREAAELGDVVKLSDVSREIQLIGCRLESTFPHLYQNVSRQVNMTLKNDAAIRRTILFVGDFLFKHGVVTWCRIVALFAVSGAVANECVMAGHPELVHVITAMVTDVISRHVAPWISQQGGWSEIMKAFRLNKTTRTLWMLSGLGAVTGFVFTWLTAMQI